MNKLILGMCLLALPHGLRANGGGYFRGGIEQLGDITGFVPSATENIALLDEKLTVSLGPRTADVEVRYVMQNVTAKRVTVRFGFPVEESFSDSLSDGGFPVDRQDSKPPEVEGLNYCRNYHISTEGQPVAAKWHAEEAGKIDNWLEEEAVR